MAKLISPEQQQASATPKVLYIRPIQEYATQYEGYIRYLTIGLSVQRSMATVACHTIGSNLVSRWRTAACAMLELYWLRPKKTIIPR